MKDWQPIDTAPKDGTWILAWGEGTYDVVQWVPDEHSPRGGYFSPEDSGSVDPQYWMPLPPAPLDGD